MNETEFIGFRSVLDAIPFGISVLNQNLRIEWANQEIVKYSLRKDSSQMRGKLCYREILGNHKPCNDCPVLLCFRTGRITRMELIADHNGEARSFSVLAIPFKNGDSLMVIEIVRDITYQKMLQDQLNHSNELTKTILDNAPISIFTIDTNGLFTSMNSVMAQKTGLGDHAKDILIGRFNWIKNPYTIKCGLAERIKESLSTGEVVQVWDFPFINYKGDRNLYMNLTGVPLYGTNGKIEGLLCIIEDTTERVKTQALLAQEARMAAVGRLAASIAHNLNNPLATIAANSELSIGLCHSLEETYQQNDKDPWRSLKHYNKVIKAEAFRCTNVINDILKLSRKEGFRLEQLDLNKVLASVIKGINFQKHGIKLVKNLQPDLPSINCDGRALQQVFLNLLNNAIDALASKPHARITIRTRYRHNTVIAEIKDNGMGIPDEIMDNIFEPFFTTKLSTKDLGLGLAFCYEFLKEMGGEMKVKSKAGQGTTFQIVLPTDADGGHN